MDEDDAEMQKAIAMSMELLGVASDGDDAKHAGEHSDGGGRKAGINGNPHSAQEAQNIDKRNVAAARDEALAMMLSVEDSQQLAETKKVLERLVLNVADHPGEPRYCTIRKDNRKIALVLQTPGAYQFLTACGFVDEGTNMVLTHRNEGEMRAAGRSLAIIDDQLADLQGAGGSLRDDGSAPPPTQSSSHVPPRHFICGRCRRMVSNDNSDGGWGTSEGEFRYKCEHCPNFSLCSTCFDQFREGRFPHVEGHTFEHVPPYERYGWGSSVSDTPHLGRLLVAEELAAVTGRESPRPATSLISECARTVGLIAAIQQQTSRAAKLQTELANLSGRRRCRPHEEKDALSLRALRAVQTPSLAMG